MKLIFDIGANHGEFSQKCFNDFKDIKIVAVEANSSLVEKLKIRFFNKNITVLDNLMSTNSGEEIDFYLNDSADTISTASKFWITNSRFSNNYKWSNSVKKISLNIDDLVSRYGKPNLIKVDVEGYELEVIKGMTQKYSEICFEWSEEQYQEANDICQYLQSIGYTEFGFIDCDNYLEKPNNYTLWNQSSFHNNINENRKERWGMIWAK